MNTPENERQLRVDLAAAFRILHRLDMHESVANHLSAAVSDDGRQFIMNRRWIHFSNVTASNLQFLDADDESVLRGDSAPDISAWHIHSSIHRLCPGARVILHAHPAYATALSTLKDPSILPIDNNTSRFYERVAYDQSFGGIANSEEEGARIAESLQGKSVLMMGNHGATVIGETVAEAFEELYYLEKACKTMILAYSSGQPLNILSEELAYQTAKGWDDFRGASFAHFEQLKAELDATDPSYLN